MDARLQVRVQRYGWDRAEEHYERGWSAQLEPAQTLLLRTADLRPGERVLDVACGTGLVTFPAALAVGSEGTVLATDLSDRMVTRVRDRARELGLGQVKAERMNAEELDVDVDSYDVALCALGLMYAPDPSRALGSMRRAVRPGGRVVAAVWGARSNCGWADIFPIVDSRVKSEVCPLFFQLGTGDALAHSMRSAGLTDVGSERISTTLEYADADEAAVAAFDAGPVAMAYSRFDDATRAEARAEYLESIEPYRDSDAYRIPGEFVVSRGVRA